MADHLDQRTVRHRAFCRQKVKFDRTVRDAGLGEMIREQFWGCETALIAFESDGYLMVQRAAAVAQQRTVRRILYQCMTEAVDLPRRLSLCHHEIGRHQ